MTVLRISFVAVTGAMLAACAAGAPAVKAPASPQFYAVAVGICPLFCIKSMETALLPGVAAAPDHGTAGGFIVKGADISLRCTNKAKLAATTAKPVNGAGVRMYGTSLAGGARSAEGVIYDVNVLRRGNVFDRGEEFVKPGEANAFLVRTSEPHPGPGFSGGPVIDARSGALLGVLTNTPRFKNDARIADGQYALAYRADRLQTIAAELKCRL